MRRPNGIAGILVALALGVAPAGVIACETALVLAMDVSGSVDPSEYRLQVDGLALALEDPAIRTVLIGDSVALSVVQWSAAAQQETLLPWRRMLTAVDVERFAGAVRSMPRAFAGSDTAIGHAITFSAASFDAVPDCRRRVIDLSGDGDENAGHSLATARRTAVAAGIEINGLAIESIGLSITSYYRARVISPGGFVETATGHMDYARAIRAKLLRELTRPVS